MQVDFYNLTATPLDRALPQVAARIVREGGRLLIVAADADQRAALDRLLWTYAADSFLPHAQAGAGDDARQPVLLSDSCEATNGAHMAIFADGLWREEAAAFDRAILLFGPEQTVAARDLWSALSGGGHALRIFKQGEGGGWREGR